MPPEDDAQKYVWHTIVASHSYCWSKKKVAMM